MAVIVLLSSLHVLVAPSALAYSIDHLKTFGTHGSGPQDIYHPLDLETDDEGNLLVVDSINHRIQKFDKDGKFLMTIGNGVGSGDGQLYYPEAVAVQSGSGYIYVADTGNHRIVVFGPTGGYIKKWGTEGSGEGQFLNPNGIAVDLDGFIYVTDKRNARVQKFTDSGTFVKQWGESGTGYGEFIVPAGIAVGGSHVYVSDEQTGFVQQFLLDGTFIRTYGGKDADVGPLQFPDELSTCATDAGGNLLRLYVAEAGDSSQVSVFETNGDFVGAFTGNGAANSSFEYPHAVHCDDELPGDSVFVASTNESKIYSFKIAEGDQVVDIKPDKKPQTLFNKHALVFRMSTQGFQNCRLESASGTLTVPQSPEDPFDEDQEFHVRGAGLTVKRNQAYLFEMPLTKKAQREVKESIDKNRAVRVEVSFDFVSGCKDEKVSYRIGS